MYGGWVAANSQALNILGNVPGVRDQGRGLKEGTYASMP
jgi:hypothetical protein